MYQDRDENWEKRETVEGIELQNQESLVRRITITWEY